MTERWRLQIRILRWARRLGLGEEQIFPLLTVLAGALCGLVAVAFHLLINWTGAWAFDSSWGSRLPFYLIPALAGLLAGIFLMKVPEARGSGIPQTKTAFFTAYGLIPLRVTLGKLFLGALCVGGGFSLGREGPTVQICSGVASFLGRLFSLSRQRIQLLLPVGAAAGLAAAFNTPIAAVTFVLEEIVGDLNARILGSTVVAAVMASVVEHSLLGDTPLLGVGVHRLHSPVELVFYLLLGLLGGGVSVLFLKGLLRGTAWVRRQGWKFWQPALGGLLVGSLAWVDPAILGIGYETVRSALRGELLLSTLLLLLVLKFLATLISYSSGAAGGIFAPTLFLGAMLGGALGTALHELFPRFVSDPGAFALVGMGTLFAGIIRAPMTSVLIIFEMTQNYAIILPLMISNLVSYYVSQRGQEMPVYDALALQEGIHLPRPRFHYVFQTLTVQDALVREVVTFPSDLTVNQALQRAETLPYLGFPVMDGQGRYVGMISVRELVQRVAAGEGEHTLGEVVRRGGPRAYPDESLELVLRRFGQHGVSRLPVLSRTNPGRLLGLITVGDVMRAFGVVREKEIYAAPERRPPFRRRPAPAHSRTTTDHSGETGPGRKG